jgi:hypothetical protein
MKTDGRLARLESHPADDGGDSQLADAAAGGLARSGISAARVALAPARPHAGP